MGSSGDYARLLGKLFGNPLVTLRDYLMDYLPYFLGGVLEMEAQRDFQIFNPNNF